MTSCPSRVLSPISWETSGPGLARGTEPSSAIAPPYSHPRSFLYGVNPSSEVVYRERLEPQCRTPTAQEVSSASVSFGTVSQSTPPTFAATPAPTGALSPQALLTWSHIVTSFTAVINACIAGSASATSTVLFRPHASKRLMMILAGASAGPFSVTAAASIAPDSSYRSVSTTSISSASPRNV